MPQLLYSDHTRDSLDRLLSTLGDPDFWTKLETPAG